MNNVRYQNEKIDPHVLPLVRGISGQVTFQQDNDPPYRARATIAHLQANNFRVMTPWATNSPDLNPLETYGITWTEWLETGLTHPVTRPP